MDDKKLLQLHTWLKEQGGTSRSFDDFKAKANSDNGKALHGFLQSEGYTDLDYDSFSNEYKSAATTPELKSANPFDLMREAVSEKPVAEKEAQKPVRDMQGYEQKGLGVPQKELRPKTGDFDINAQPIFKDNVPSVYQNTLSFERPQDAMGDFFSDGREESDPIKAGIQKYAELKKSESPIKQLESIVEATRPKIDPNNPLQVHTARYQKAINRDKAAITNIVNTTVNPISQTEEGGIMDYILPKSDLSQLSSAAEALILNKSAEAIQQRLDKGEILSRTQSEALKIAQKRAGSPDASPKELARIMQAIEENDDKTLLNYVAPLDREFAKTAYNNIDKDRTAAAYKKRPNELTSKERLGFWFGTTKYNQQRKDKDDPAYLPYTMLAHDDQNISQQIERLKTLFPDQEGGVMSLEPPKGLAAEFPKPAERAYAYYQILANRYTQLTKELQNESISMDKEDKANLLDERLKANSMLQGAAIFLPIVGVQDVTNPKVKEWYSVLNKINALAPMIRNAKVGAAENEAQDYTLGRFTNTTAEAALDIYGAPYEKTDRARIAGEQSEVINDAEINTKTGMNPESIAILKERSKSGDIDDLATWGNTAGGFAGIMMPFMAAGMVGGNKLQSTTQGLSRLDKGSQIGRVLLNAEGGLTKTGWLAQKAINLGMTGLQYEYAGAISGEGKDLRNELRFSQGVLGYAGSQALTGSLGLLMKGGMKLGGKFVSKIPYFEKGIKAIEEAYGSKYANYAKAYLANGFSELGEEIPQDWRNNLEEVKGDDIFQKMLAAAQKTADDIAYDDIEGKYSMSKALGYALPIIAMGGKYDGIGVEDVHKISDWAVTFGEQITGEKTSEEDKQTIREFSDFIAEQAGQSPANVRFTDKGTLFTLDGKEYLYNAETQSVTSKQGVTEPEKQNAVAVAQEMMANYNKAIKEGDFTGLFGENVRPYNKQNEETAIPQHQEVSAQEIVQETPLQDPLLQIPEIPQELTFPAETNTQTESIQNKSQKVQQEIKNKSLFSIGGTFSSELGGSNQESVPTERRVVNGIEFVQFSNPTTGIADVIMTGTSGRDFVGYYRIYDENGKPTNRWSSKLENQSRNKENIKTMFEVTQQMLPNGHEYTEATSISTDGLRVWQQSLNRGYELQRDDNGGIITNRVAINGDAIENVLGIEVNRGDFDNISVSSSKQFNSVKRALLPFLEKIGMGENNIYWENGTVYIDLPVLKKAEQVAQEVPIIESAEAIQEAPEVEAAEIEQPNGLFSEPKSYLIKDAPDVTDLVMSSDLLDTEANQGGQEDLREAIRDNPKIKAKLIEVRKSEGKTAVTILAGGERYEFAINESPTKKEAETQKTAEELDARRTEIESRLPQIEAELEALRSKPILESTEEDADMEDFLLAEQADLQNEFEDIAETRKTVRTAKETEIEQEAQRVEALTQKTQRVADIEGEIAQIEGASKALPIRERLSAKANIEALNAEKEALSTEIEALQPKKETPVIQENRITEKPIAETPIIAETPQLETPIVESKKKEPEPIQKEAVVEKLPEVGGIEESGAPEVIIGRTFRDEYNRTFEVKGENAGYLTLEDIDTGKILRKKKDEVLSTFKEIKDEPISKSDEIKNSLPKGGDIKGVTRIDFEDDGDTVDYGTKSSGVKITVKRMTLDEIKEELKWKKRDLAERKKEIAEFDKDAIWAYKGMSYEEKKKAIKLNEENKREVITNEKIDIPFLEKHIEIREREGKKQESAKEKVAEKETPVAPAAPKEQKPQPEKGESKRKPKTEPPKPPATPKEPTTIKPVKSGSELAEMLGNTEQAIETGKLWDRVAKMWAKKTGKTIEDWWDRIESIQVGGEGQKGSVKFENGKFIVFLASDRDVSTPVHELAHIFQTDLSESEKKSVVAWYNKGNKTNHKVTDWGFAENETSRNISEYFAEGFIEWLKEGGKSTDKEMQSIFEKFKEWLKDVVNTVFDAKVELNDDMRAIYEQIFTEKEKEELKVDNRGAKKGSTILVVPRDLIDKSATNPLQVVWNYFAEGGRINREDAIKRLKSRYKGKEIPSDIMIAIAPFIKKEGQKRGDIVHNLYEMVSQEHPLLELTDQDFDSAMDEVLDSLGGNFRGDMIAALQGFKNREEEYVPTEDEIMEMENREAIEAAMYEVFEEQDMEIVNPIVYDLFEGIDRFEAETISREIEKATDKDGNVDWDKIESLIDFLLTNPESAKTAKFKSLIEKNNESRQVQSSEVLSSISEKVAESAADKAYRAKREAEFAEKIGKLRQNLKTAKDEAAKKYATLTKNEIGFEKEGKNVQLELVSEAEKEMSDIERIMIPYKSAIADVEREIKRLQDTMDKVIDAEIKKRNENVLFQTDPYHKSLEDWLVGEISAETLQSNPEELRAEAFDEIVGDVGETVANEIIDRAFERIKQANKALPKDEQTFGRKVRDIYADRMSDVFRERMSSETFAHTVQSNKLSFQMGLDRINEVMEDAVAEVAKEWNEKGKTPASEATIEEWLKDDIFMGEVLIKAAESLAKSIKTSNNVFNDTGEITELIVSGQMIIALIDESYAKLSDTKKVVKAEAVFQAGLEMTKLLSQAGTKFGQAINLYKFLKPMSGKFVNRMLKSTIDEIMSDISVDNRIKSELIGLVLDTDRQIMEEEAESGKVIDAVMDNIEDSEAVNRLIEEIEAHKAAWEKQHKEVIELGKKLADIQKSLDATIAERDTAKEDLAQTEIDLKEAQKQATRDAAKIKRLSDKILDYKKEIRAKDKEIARLEGEKTTTEKQQVVRGASNATKRANENKTLIKSILGIKPANVAFQLTKKAVALGISVATDLQNLGYTFEDASKIIKVINKLVTNNTISVYEEGNKTYNDKFADKVIAATIKELNDMGADATMVATIETALKNSGAMNIMQAEIEKVARKDYQAAMRNRIVGILSNTDPKKVKDAMKVELRTVLKDLVKKSVMEGKAEFAQVRSLLIDVLGIDTANAMQDSDFMAILQKEWAKQTANKREQLIKERLKTNAEKNEIADEKEKKEYLEKVQKIIDNPLPKLVQDMLTDSRLFTDGMQAVRDAYAEKYMLPAISETQMADIRNQLDVVDKAPVGVLRDEAQMNLFRMYAKLFPISPIRKSHYLGDSMFHANNLSGVPTHITNITWSALELFTNVGSAIFQAFNPNKRAYLSAMAKVAMPDIGEVGSFMEGLKAAFSNFFTSELRRNTLAQFSISALRYQNEAIHVANYMNRNYAEMERLSNREKRVIENTKIAKQRLDDGKITQAQYDKLVEDSAEKRYGILSDLGNMIVNLFTGRFGQALSNAYIGEIGNTGISGAALVSALLNGADVFFRTLHYAGTHAELLSKSGLVGNPSKQAFASKDSEAIKFEYKGKIESIGEILGKEVLGGDYEKDTPMYFQRRRELHQEAMEQLFGAAELAKDYSLRKMFKLRPPGMYGQLYDLLQKGDEFTSELGLKQAEKAYAHANEMQQSATTKAAKAAWWAAKQAIHAGYLVGKVVMALPRTIAYVRVGFNIVERLASYEALYSVLNTGAVALQTSFGEGNKYERQRRFLKWNLQNSFESANQKRRVSTIAHVNVGAEIADSQDAINKLDSDIAKINYSETEKKKELNEQRKAAKEKAVSLLDNQLSKGVIDQAKYDTEKATAEAKIDREFNGKITDVERQATAKRTAKESIKKAVVNKQNAQRALYDKEKNDLAWQVTGNIIRFGLLMVAFAAHDDDDDEEKILDLSVVGGKKDFKGIRTPSSIRLEVMGRKMSFPATSTPFALDLAYFGGLFALERAERNTTKQKTTGVDKAAQAFPAIINAMWGVAAMTGMQDMINAFSGNDKSSSYLTLEEQYERQWAQYIRVFGNMQAVKVPAIARGITKDISYGGENIEIDKNAPFGEQIALNFARGLGLMDIGLGRIGTPFRDVVAPQVSDLDGKPIYLWQGGDKFNPYHYFSDMIRGKDTDRDPYAVSGDASKLLDFYDWIDKNGIQDVIQPVTGASYKTPQFDDNGQPTGRMMNLPTVPLSAIRAEIGAKAFQKLSEMHNKGVYRIEIGKENSRTGSVGKLVEFTLKGDFDTEANKYSVIFKNDKEGAKKFVVQEAAKDLYANENKKMQGVWSKWIKDNFGKDVVAGKKPMIEPYELQQQFKARPK